MLGDNMGADGKAEAGSVGLGGVERLKKMRAMFEGNAKTRVTDVNSNRYWSLVAGVENPGLHS